MTSINSNDFYNQISPYSDQIISLITQNERNKHGIDTYWLNYCLYLIFFMQIGFNLLEAGSGRHKNFNYTLIKNMMNICVTSIFFWLFGYAFEWGDSSNGAIGTNFFAGKGMNTVEHYNKWMIHWAFSVTSIAIGSGIVMERLNIFANMIHTAVFVGFIYPLGVHWGWHPEGFLAKLGYSDFSGSGIIHMAGAASGLAALLVVKERKGRYDKDKEADFKCSNPTFLAFATLFLWWCWYGFNCGSTELAVGTYETDYSLMIGRIGMNNGIAAAAGGIVVFVTMYFMTKEWDIGALCNGILVGLVAVGACINVCEQWAALIIGTISGFVYIGYSLLFKKLQLDDPCDAFAIHYGTGFWGVVAVSFFNPENGMFYNHGGRQLGIQLLACLVFSVWSFVATYVLFLLMKVCKILDLSEEIHEKGFDIVKCGGMGNYYDGVSSEEYNKNIKEGYIISKEREIKKIKEQEVIKKNQDVLKVDIKNNNMKIELKDINKNTNDNNENKNVNHNKIISLQENNTDRIPNTDRIDTNRNNNQNEKMIK